MRSGPPRTGRMPVLATCVSYGLSDPSLSIRRVQLQVAGDLPLPAVAVRQKPFLAVVKFFARLGREFEIRTFDDGVHRAGFLAQPAINALHHVDVVAGGAARAIFARLRLDGDSLGGADSL